MKRISFFSWSLMLVVLVSGLVMTGCSEDEEETPSLNPNYLSLHVGETASLTYRGGKCTWISDEPLIASVSNTGVVKAKLVGTTTIKANNLTCKVSVNPKYNTYTEPSTNWGCSQNTIKSFMNGYKLLNSSQTELVYEGYEKALGYIYSFEHSQLVGCAIMIETIYSEELAKFLSERYILADIDYENFTTVFYDLKMKTLIGVKFFITGHIMVGYLDYEYATRCEIEKLIFYKNIDIQSYIEINSSETIHKSESFKDFLESIQSLK